MIEMKKIRRATGGFTLTEAAIVLGIVGLILGAIWVAAASVYSNLRVSKTSEQLLQIVQAVRSIHATQSTVDPNLTAILVSQAGGVPSDMVSRDAAGAVTSVRDVWGGDVVIAPQSYNGIADSAFSVSFSRVPQSACTDLLVRNTGDGRDTGLVGAGNAAATNTTFPITLTMALGQCGVTGAAGNNVVFTFRLKA